MTRSLTALLGVLAGLVLCLGAAPALACDGDPNCTCDHAKMEEKAAKDGKTSKKKAAKVDEKKPETTPAEVKPAQPKQGSLLDELDQLIAAKCSCTSAADCTCKKGTCKCAKCGGRQEVRLFDSLKGERDVLKVPDDARRDATAGVFI